MEILEKRSTSRKTICKLEGRNEKIFIAVNSSSTSELPVNAAGLRKTDFKARIKSPKNRLYERLP